MGKDIPGKTYFPVINRENNLVCVGSLVGWETGR